VNYLTASVTRRQEGLTSGLPDGIFSNQKSKFGYFLEILQLKAVVNFFDIWSILQLFGILYGHLVYFSPFWYFVPRKIWQP
jgi:hypothetical protein